MSFRIVIHPKVIRKISKLPKSHQKKTADLIEILKISPIPYKRFDIKKIRGFDNIFRVRFGDYRLVYEIDKEEKTIFILKLEKREKIYK